MSRREMSQRQAVAYIYDMIEQIAQLARRSGETYAAIHLEAIIAARRALAEDQAIQDDRHRPAGGGVAL